MRWRVLTQQTQHAEPTRATFARRLVHGHFPVKDVERRGNRWNVDTGAGIERLDRRSILEANTPEICGWTLDADER